MSCRSFASLYVEDAGEIFWCTGGCERRVRGLRVIGHRPPHPGLHRVIGLCGNAPSRGAPSKAALRNSACRTAGDAGTAENPVVLRLLCAWHENCKNALACVTWPISTWTGN